MLKNIFAIFIVLASVLSLGLKFTASGNAIEVEGPGVLHTTPSGNLSVQVGSELWILDKDNIHLKTISFSDHSEHLNIKGDYEFFSNGDLLVHSTQTEQSFSDNFTAFLRNQQKDSIPSSANEGLYRCNSSGYDCRLFSNSFAKLGTVFRLSIDRKNDTVYLADTGRFILYKFDANGVLLATQNNGFEFPNQIVFDNDAVFVANTNHNGITKVESKTSVFGEKIQHYPTRIDNNHIWPAQITKVGSDWWVTLATAGMVNAAIQVYDENFEPVRTITQAENADVISIAYFNDSIWTSDNTNLEFTRYTRDGETINSPIPTDLSTRLQAAQSEREHFTQLSDIGHWLFIAVLVFGVIAAYFIEKKATLNTLTGRTDDEDTNKVEAQIAPDNKGVVWYENKFRKYLPTFFYTTALVTVFFAFWAVLGLLSEQTEGHFSAYVSLFASVFFVIIYRLTLPVFRNRIGISGNLILAEDFNGKVAASPIASIGLYHNRLLVNDVVIATGTNINNFSFYSHSAFKNTVLPKIPTVNKVAHLDYYKGLWNNYRLLMVESALLLVAPFILSIFI